MKKSWFDYNRQFTSENLFNKLKAKEKEFLNKFKDYILVSASEIRANESIREILRFKEITGCNFNNIILEDFHHYLKELRQSSFSDNSKNKVKSFVHRFLKWACKDWSERFNEFEDLKYNSEAENLNPYKEEDMISEKELEKLMKEENSLFWKCYLITSWEAGLRTKEARELKKSQISFDEDGFSILNIPSKKNKFGSVKTKPVLIKKSTPYIKELIKSQKELNIESEYLFPSPRNPKEPISKSVNKWFGDLTLKVLGKRKANYILRHSRGTLLQEKVRKGEIPKDSAVEFMRHSEKMFDKVYSHMSGTSKRKLMKKQLYNEEELTKEQKHKLELEIERQENKMKQLKDELEASKQIEKKNTFEMKKIREENKYFSHWIKIFTDLHSGKITQEEATLRMKAVQMNTDEN